MCRIEKESNELDEINVNVLVTMTYYQIPQQNQHYVDHSENEGHPLILWRMPYITKNHRPSVKLLIVWRSYTGQMQ